MKRIFDYYKRCESGAYIIQMRVSDLDELFSPYDPSPIHERDVHPSLMNLIFKQIVVFPEGSKVELHIHLPKRIKRKKLEPEIEQAIKNHFEYELLDSELHLQRRLRKGFRTFMYAGVIFLGFLTSSYLIENIGIDHVLIHLLAGGLEVGAWVSLWHPIETLLYDWLPLYEDKKKFSRLRDMKIEFKYF